jgi:hypothetical protein
VQRRALAGAGQSGRGEGTRVIEFVLGSLVFTLLPTGDPGGVAVDDPVASAARPHARAAWGLTLGQLRRMAAILADSGIHQLPRRGAGGRATRTPTYTATRYLA